MKITFLTLFSLNLLAIELGKPQMLVQMLKFKQQRLSKISCHEPLSSTVDKEVRNRESFEATISCDIKCAQKAHQTVSVQKEFNPKDYSLSPGDGSSPDFTLWRSLGITLNIFKKQVCFDKAKMMCKRIESFKVNSISSGDWRLKEDITCDTKSIIKSPFDLSFKLKQKYSTKIKEHKVTLPWGGSARENLKPLKKILTSKESEDLYDIKNCKTKIKITSCFGDCIFDDPDKKNSFIETLATPGPLGEDYYELCIDSEINNIRDKAKSVSIYKCEKFIWNKVTSLGLSGESCAALRYNTNCAELF